MDEFDVRNLGANEQLSFKGWNNNMVGLPSLGILFPKRITYISRPIRKIPRSPTAPRRHGDHLIKLCAVPQFLDMCLLAGCDYLISVPGLGLKTAYKLVKQHRHCKKVHINTPLI